MALSESFTQSSASVCVCVCVCVWKRRVLHEKWLLTGYLSEEHIGYTTHIDLKFYINLNRAIALTETVDFVSPIQSMDDYNCSIFSHAITYNTSKQCWKGHIRSTGLPHRGKMKYNSSGYDELGS